MSSVIETVSHLVGEGIAAAREWVMYGGTGDEPISERTLRRWRQIIQSRLIGSALAWLGPRLGITWSDALDPRGQFEILLDRLTPPVLLAFRVATGRSVLDTAAPPRTPPRSASRPVPGRLAPAPPPDPPRDLLRRGARCRARGRNPPAEDTHGGHPP